MYANTVPASTVRLHERKDGWIDIDGLMDAWMHAFVQS